MGLDLRELFKEDREVEKFQLKEGHEDRFLDRLEVELPSKRKSLFYFMKIAAGLAILVSVGLFAYNSLSKDGATIETTVVDAEDNLENEPGISLGDLSPDLKKIENYYVANINIELSKLEVSTDNKAMVDGFMDRLSELNTEYERLNTELNQIGPNDQTINALIKNLQLRLQLLHKLKEKLNELKSSKNEHESNTI